MKKRTRTDNGYRRRALRERVKAEGRCCAICGEPIDYSLPAGHPLSYELDEIIPFSLGGSALEYANVQPAHRICNQKKSNKVAYTLQSSKKREKKPNTTAITPW